MKCLYCGSEESKVVDSRSVDLPNSIKRRRECLGCGKRFTTYETIETTQILVIKRDGTRQQFSPNKIKSGIMKACEKRPISMQQIDEVVATIEKRIQNSLDSEIKTETIGEYVMDELKLLDEVAYIRFASVYKQFGDLDAFQEFVQNLSEIVKLKQQDEE